MNKKILLFPVLALAAFASAVVLSPTESVLGSIRGDIVSTFQVVDEAAESLPLEEVQVTGTQATRSFLNTSVGQFELEVKVPPPRRVEVGNDFSVEYRLADQNSEGSNVGFEVTYGSSAQGPVEVIYPRPGQQITKKIDRIIPLEFTFACKSIGRHPFTINFSIHKQVKAPGQFGDVQDYYSDPLQKTLSVQCTQSVALAPSSTTALNVANAPTTSSASTATPSKPEVVSDTASSQYRLFNSFIQAPKIAYVDQPFTVLAEAKKLEAPYVYKERASFVGILNSEQAPETSDSTWGFVEVTKKSVGGWNLSGELTTDGVISPSKISSVPSSKNMGAALFTNDEFRDFKCTSPGTGTISYEATVQYTERTERKELTLGIIPAIPTEEQKTRKIQATVSVECRQPATSATPSATALQVPSSGAAPTDTQTPTVSAASLDALGDYISTGAFNSAAWPVKPNAPFPNTYPYISQSQIDNYKKYNTGVSGLSDLEVAALVHEFLLGAESVYRVQMQKFNAQSTGGAAGPGGSGTQTGTSSAPGGAGNCAPTVPTASSCMDDCMKAVKICDKCTPPDPDGVIDQSTCKDITSAEKNALCASKCGSQTSGSSISTTGGTSSVSGGSVCGNPGSTGGSTTSSGGGSTTTTGGGSTTAGTTSGGPMTTTGGGSTTSSTACTPKEKVVHPLSATITFDTKRAFGQDVDLSTITKEEMLRLQKHARIIVTATITPINPFHPDLPNFISLNQSSTRDGNGNGITIRSVRGKDAYNQSGDYITYPMGEYRPNEMRKHGEPLEIEFEIDPNNFSPRTIGFYVQGHEAVYDPECPRGEPIEEAQYYELAPVQFGPQPTSHQAAPGGPTAITPEEQLKNEWDEWAQGAEDDWGDWDDDETDTDASDVVPFPKQYPYVQQSKIDNYKKYTSGTNGLSDLEVAALVHDFLFDADSRYKFNMQNFWNQNDSIASSVTSPIESVLPDLDKSTYKENAVKIREVSEGVKDAAAAGTDTTKIGRLATDFTGQGYNAVQIMQRAMLAEMYFRFAVLINYQTYFNRSIQSVAKPVDLPPNFVFQRAVLLAYANGLFSATADGKFRPYDAVNQAVFLTTFTRFLGLKLLSQVPSTTPFAKLVRQAWYVQYYWTLYMAMGLPRLDVDPEANVSTKEAESILDSIVEVLVLS